MIIPLYATATVREIANWYYLTTQAVREAIYRGKLVARQTECGLWLCSLDSVREVWGEPQQQHTAIHNAARSDHGITLWKQLDIFPDL